MLPVCREHFLLPERMGKLETKRIIMDEKAMQRAIARISYEIIERNKGVSGLCIVGIISRGVPLGRRICAKLSELEGAEVPFGSLDITKYRDDHSGADHNDRTDIPFDIRDKNVIIAVLKFLHPEMEKKLDELKIKFEFSEPFGEDEKENWQKLEGLYTAGLVSLDEAVRRLSLTDSPEEEVAKIMAAKQEPTEQ